MSHQATMSLQEKNAFDHRPSFKERYLQCTFLSFKWTVLFYHNVPSVKQPSDIL